MLGLEIAVARLHAEQAWRNRLDAATPEERERMLEQRAKMDSFQRAANEAALARNQSAIHVYVHAVPMPPAHGEN